ncbi:MAG: DUF3052 family protein [Chloroflexota bacterium]
MPREPEIYVRNGSTTPPTLLQKLGIKAGQRILLVGKLDRGFAVELMSAGADVATRPRPDNDLIFLDAPASEALWQLVPLQEHLKRDGAIWTIRPKGVKVITERDVMEAAKAAGLVDVKVARFSETLTAEKLVIPVAQR